MGIALQGRGQDEDDVGNRSFQRMRTLVATANQIALLATMIAPSTLNTGRIH